MEFFKIFDTDGIALERIWNAKLVYNCSTNLLPSLSILHTKIPHYNSCSTCRDRRKKWILRQTRTRIDPRSIGKAQTRSSWRLYCCGMGKGIASDRFVAARKRKKPPIWLSNYVNKFWEANDPFQNRSSGERWQTTTNPWFNRIKAGSSLTSITWGKRGEKQSERKTLVGVETLSLPSWESRRRVKRTMSLRIEKRILLVILLSWDFTP